MIIGKLKEAIICLTAGRVTLRYPFEPSVVPDGFRGQPQLDIDKCTGCGACSMACPTRCIEITDEAELRTMVYCLDRCSYCACCQEVCPEEAIALSAEFELATDTIADLRITAQFDLVRCEECGQVVGTRREIEKLAAEMPDKVGLSVGQISWLQLCAECKRKRSLETARDLQAPGQ